MICMVSLCLFVVNNFKWILHICIVIWSLIGGRFLFVWRDLTRLVSFEIWRVIFAARQRS